MKPFVLLAALAILVAGYVLGYWMVLAPSPTPDEWTDSPMAATFFAPVHWIDLRLRPDYWHRYVPDLDDPIPKRGSSDW